MAAQYISLETEMKSPVLQTRLICEQHGSERLAEKLKEVVLEWKLERPRKSIAVKTNNAKNVISAVCEARPGPPVLGANY